MIKFRRRAAAAAIALCVPATLLTAAATPAAATLETAVSATAVYADSSAPSKSFTATGTDVAVGAWLDEGHRYHSTKAYFTFDLRPYRGAQFTTAWAYATETAANDCTKPRATEMWVTDAAAQPTWRHQPKELTKPAGPGAQPGCLWNRVEWDTTKSITDAVAAGKDSVTLVLRLPENRQFDLAYGRRVESHLHLFLDYNRPPGVPANLQVGIKPCGTDLVYTPDNPVTVYGLVPDPDGSSVSAKLAVWAADDPAHRIELGPDSATPSPHNVRFQLPADFVTDGRVFLWTLQGVDGTLTGPPSAPCAFVADRVAPTTAPTVTSTDYPHDGAPHGGQGIPGKFTMDARGDTEIVGFATSHGYVPADRPGGVATTEDTPRTEFASFGASGVDRAGNSGPMTTYGYQAAPTRPGATSNADDVTVDEPLTLHFTPGAMPGVVEYVYNFDATGDRTIAALPDGTATVTVTPFEQWNSLSVHSRTAAGWTSQQWSTGSLFLGNGKPAVSSVSYPPGVPSGGPGVPGEFTFTTHRAGVVSFGYSLDSGTPGTVAAVDGTATVTVTPATAGAHTLVVTSTNADGSTSLEQYYSFQVKEA